MGFGSRARRYLFLVPFAAFAVLGPVGGPQGTPRSALADDPAPAPSPAPAPAEQAAPVDPEAAKAKAEFDEIVAIQDRRQYATARKKFREWLEKWPACAAELRQEADERSAENCFLGMEQIHKGGPSDNRLDVELMADGYLITQQDTFRKQAEDQLKEFWREPLWDEYGSYLNIWRFDLASKEEGVDEVARGPEPEAPDPKKPRKKTKPLKEYSTALNCQAAGPQNQVWADPDMVFKWRKFLKVSDGLSICFAKKGELGMGGMGIATTGRRVAVVHEFGHAFIGLLDEYANNPNAPAGHVAARNAISGKGPKEPPDLDKIPWKHWLDAKNSEVGVFLGGATYQLGVFRPATSCAMNAGGGSPLCWVCREAGVLKLYEYVNPIDEEGPVEKTVAYAHGEKREFYVVPLAPKSHKLETTWYLEKLKSRAVTKGEDDEEEPVPAAEPAPASAPEEGVAHNPDGWSRGPMRGFARHAEPWPPGPPRGDVIEGKERKAANGSYRSTVVLEGLAVGRYRLTARVRDDTKIGTYKFPWVIHDPDKLLEERRTWEVEVK